LGRAALHGLSSVWSVRVRASSAAQFMTLSGNPSTDMRLQPPIAAAADLSSNAQPETPIANPWNTATETPVAAVRR
jgi:hypothetical protein